MQIASISAAVGQNPENWLLDKPVQAIPDAGQNLPTPAQDAQYNYSDLVSTPRASLTASATTVASQQSVETFTETIIRSQATAAYQSSQNAKGLYGYQSMLGAPLMG